MHARHHRDWEGYRQHVRGTLTPELLAMALGGETAAALEWELLPTGAAVGQD